VNSPKPHGICLERERLMRKYTDAVSAHSEIVKTYGDAQSKPGFTDVLAKGGMARIATENARRALEAHITEHGCGSLSE
jgi:hypothetical protein